MSNGVRFLLSAVIASLGSTAPARRTRRTHRHSTASARKQALAYNPAGTKLGRKAKEKTLGRLPR